MLLLVDSPPLPVVEVLVVPPVVAPPDVLVPPVPPLVPPVVVPLVVEPEVPVLLVSVVLSLVDPVVEPVVVVSVVVEPGPFELLELSEPHALARSTRLAHRPRVTVSGSKRTIVTLREHMIVIEGRVPQT